MCLDISRKCINIKFVNHKSSLSIHGSYELNSTSPVLVFDSEMLEKLNIIQFTKAYREGRGRENDRQRGIERVKEKER